MRALLTVFDWVEERATRVKRRKEENAWVDRHSRCNQRDLLKIIELAREVGSLFRIQDHKQDDKKEDREGLNASTQSLKEDWDEDHGHFSKHDHTLPVITVRVVAIEEESVLALNFWILKLISRFVEKKPCSQRNAKDPEKKTRDATKQRPQEVRPSEALDIEIPDESELWVDSTTAKCERSLLEHTKDNVGDGRVEEEEQNDEGGCQATVSLARAVAIKHLPESEAYESEEEREENVSGEVNENLPNE